MGTIRQLVPPAKSPTGLSAPLCGAASQPRHSSFLWGFTPNPEAASRPPSAVRRRQYWRSNFWRTALVPPAKSPTGLSAPLCGAASQPRHSSLAGWLYLLCAVTPANTLAHVDLAVQSGPSIERVHCEQLPSIGPRVLSQQSCNTQCQEQQTDCALRCDQDAACIRRCRAEADDCSARCLRIPTAPPAERPTSTLEGLLVPTAEAVWVFTES
jgi:hypothetical protein